MRVYGFDDTDVQRGELRAAKVGPELMHFEGEAQAVLGWSYLSTRFSDAQAELLRQMQAAEVDEEMQALVRTMKASFIPVENED